MTDKKVKQQRTVSSIVKVPFKDLLTSYPHLTMKDIYAALVYSADVTE